MFILGILSWWYGPGWRLRAIKVREQLEGMMDYFSIDLLLRTLFSPFRQISAGKVNGPLAVQLRAFFDRLISRAIGGMIRITMVIIGCLVLVVFAVVGLIVLVVWALIPLLPLIGMVLWFLGWMPWIR